jgi:hypothetical protein
MSAGHRWLLLPLLLSLAACDETRFALDPLGQVRGCAPELAGVWRIEDDGGGAPEFVDLGADCALRLLRPAPGGEGGVDYDAIAPRTIELAPSIARIDGALYLSLTDEDFHRAADEDATDTGHPGSTGGYHVYRIELRGDTASVRAVDHPAVARAIIDGKLEGEVHKDERGLKNLLVLDTAATRELLGERWLFSSAAPLRLVRTPVDRLPRGIRSQVEAPE